MPTYVFKDTNTDEVFEVVLKISEREQFMKDFPHFIPVVTAPAIVSGVGGVRNDAGWNEVLNKVSEQNPDSNLARSVKPRSAKEVKVQNVVDKWKKRNNL